MHPLTELIRADMKPALGVTEPGAIVCAAAKAHSYPTEPVQSIHVTMNSGIYKNAFTCGIPNSTHFGEITSRIYVCATVRAGGKEHTSRLKTAILILSASPRRAWSAQKKT